jgi:hypothetical protein
MLVQSECAWLASKCNRQTFAGVVPRVNDSPGARQKRTLTAQFWAVSRCGFE